MSELIFETLEIRLQKTSDGIYQVVDSSTTKNFDNLEDAVQWFKLISRKVD